MTDLERALNDIANIRNQIADVQLFRGFGPLVIAATGGLAFALSVMQSAASASDNIALLMPWIVLAFLSALLIGVEMWSLSRREHGANAQTFLWSIVQKFLPAMMAGAAIGWIVLQTALRESWILPGLWQVLIALGIFAAMPMLPRQIILVAGWYFLTGLTTLLLASHSASISTWYMGLPFGVGQILMAGLLHLAPEKHKRGA